MGEGEFSSVDEGANRFGNCQRRVWLFPLPSDERGSFCLKYAFCQFLVFRLTPRTDIWDFGLQFSFGIRHLPFGFWFARALPARRERWAHLDTATSGITRTGAPVSDPAFMGRCRGRAGPEVGAPGAVSRCVRERFAERFALATLHDFRHTRSSCAYPFC